MKHRFPITVATAACLASTLAFTPSTAEACGGTFCDAPGQQVDQTGEVVAFVIDGSRVEAHIQIQYTPNTEADQFAWVIPLQTLPEFRVGSDPFFQNLLAGTVPTYQLTTSFEFCGDDNEGGSEGGFDSAGTTAGPTGTSGTGDGESDGGEPPEVVHMQTVGAFDVVVLEGGTVESLMTWLGDNGYQQDEAAAPIFEEYLNEGYKFAAFKLSQSAGIDSIHPVVLEYEGAEACVPIRLTRIAAEEDMEIRAFFLGNYRTVPTNYRHVLVNHIKIDWLNLGGVAAQYKDLITQAVDSFKADGHAFVTEYAGASNVVPRFGIYSEIWDSKVFAGADPKTVVDTLSNQGIMECYGDFCNYFHPLIGSVVSEFLPVPDGLDAGTFYSCLDCYADLIDMETWGDGQGFADAYASRVIEPGQQADALLDKWPFLTRMYTTISPGEMTEDPMFHQNESLGLVDNNITAARTMLCNGDSVVRVPPDRDVYLPAGSNWPDFNNEMPWSMEVQTVALEGAPQVLADNGPIIDEVLLNWNSAHNWPPDPATNTTGTGTGGDTESSTGQTDSAGCGCRQTAPGGGALALFAGFGLLAWTRRRRD